MNKEVVRKKVDGEWVVTIPEIVLKGLLRQAEKVQKLEAENRRYREAIERALDESGWGDEWNALYKTIGILTKVLESDE